VIVPAVFFLSDYGTADEYVGVVHAVLHRLAPSVAVIDLTHQVPPFDVGGGASLLVRCAPHLGAGVVLAVVDPGVGTDRRGVAVELGSGGPSWLVGPDNGLLQPAAAALGGARSRVELDRPPVGAARGRSATSAPDRVARTFDGRDVFAPAAAHLALGGDPGELGPVVAPDSLVRCPATTPGPAERIEDGPDGSVAVTSVRRVDRFGNLELGVEPDVLEAIGLTAGRTAPVAVGAERSPGHGASVPVRRVGVFADLDTDELGLLIDSAGRVALALDRASAAVHLGRAGAGDVVCIGPVPATGAGH
jgi:hypothetical protein